jgi:uncharacterized protein YecE (DUF72 family)
MDYYLKFFNTVEINNSFYKLPSPETFELWRKSVPEDFLFIVKASRFITHNKKLLNPESSFERFWTNVVALKNKLGIILFQLPPTWKVNRERFETFLKALPKKHRYVFEFRNPTWYDDGIYQLMEKYNIGFCIYELNGHLSPEVVTANFVYVRLHGPGAKYQGSYDDEALTIWADKISAWKKDGKDVFCFFDNDEEGYAAFNAIKIKELLQQ